MFRLLSQKPALSAAVCLATLTFGAVWAHRSGPPRADLAPLATTVHAIPPSPPPVPRWRDELDLSLATRQGDHLVQEFTDGSRVQLTLDADLQAKTNEYLRAYELPYAAAVLYRLDTGEVLVLAGHSELSPDVSIEKLCLTPWAPAASVFKIVTAGALLERGVPAASRICYHGGLRGLTAANLKDHPRLDHACHNLADGVARSLNSVMAKLAHRHLGADTLRDWAERFGFNRPIPFDAHAVASRAAIPDDPLELARTAAGFWHTEISALHGAVIAAVAANGGLLRWPHAVQSVTMADGTAQVLERPAPMRVLTEDTARALASMLALTVTEGTARRGFHSQRGAPLMPGLSVAGKTGSLTRREPYVAYNWFVGYAPADRPQVAFSVLLGNPPRWRIKAATAARMLLQRYFQRRRDLQATRASEPPPTTAQHQRKSG